MTGFNNTRAFDVTPKAGGVSSTLGSIDYSRFHLKGHGGLHARVQTDCTVPVPSALASEGTLGGTASMQSSFAFLTVMEPCPGGWGPGSDNVCIRCPSGFYSVDGDACKAYVESRSVLLEPVPDCAYPTLCRLLCVRCPVASTVPMQVP